MRYNLYEFLPSPDDPFVDYITVSMPYAVLPNSCYNVNDNNNRLEILAQGNYLVYTIPKGNYSVATFMTALTALLPGQYTMTFNSTTNKFSIVNSTYAFQLLNTSTIDYVMGFSGTETSTLTAPYSLTLSRSVCFLPPPVFNILTDSIYNGTVLGALNPNFGNVLASVPNSGKLGVETVYQNAIDEFIFRPTMNGMMTLSIVDANGLLLDFNGLASYFALQFRIYRKNSGRVIGSFQDLAQNSARMRALIAEE